MSTKVTFLMPAYNAYPYIRHSVSSMMKQSMKDFHAIIIDDGSTDKTSEYLDSIRDSRFEIVHQKNAGYVAALTNGAKLITTEYIARLDADDIALPERLSKQVNFLDLNPNVAVVGCHCGYIFLSDYRFSVNLLFKRFQPELFPQMEKPPFWNPIKDGHNLTHPSATIRRAAFESVGGYRSLAPAEDYDLWIRLHDAGYSLACLPDVLCLYRVSVTSVSSQSFLRQGHTARYVNYCHQIRSNHLEPPSFEEYATAFPLSIEIQIAAKNKLLLRNAMGYLLAGNFIKGGSLFFQPS